MVPKLVGVEIMSVTIQARAELARQAQRRIRAELRIAELLAQFEETGNTVYLSWVEVTEARLGRINREIDRIQF